MLALRLVAAIALSANLGSVVFAQSEEGRFEATCGLLLNNIYCFGGTVLSKDKKENSDQSINVLDITANNGLATEALTTKWTSISSDTNGVELAVRTNPLGLALPDGENMVLIGGWNFGGNSRLKNHAITFNAKSKKWTAYPNYQEPPFGERQIYSGSATYIPSRGVALYGGFETHRNDAYTYNGTNMTAFNTDSDGRRIGFTSLTLFDLNNKASPWSIPSQTNLPPPTAFPNYQASILDPKTNIIYYIGGSKFDGAGRGYIYYELSSATAFNLNTGAWGEQKLTGAYTPTSRYGHSATMLPSGRDIMIYGGSAYNNNMLPVSDFCFTLNLDTFTWTQHSIPNAPPGTKLERIKHSAILVNNTVFIVLGKDNTGFATNSVLTLDVSNPLNISYVDKHVNPNIPLYSSSQPTQTPQNPTPGDEKSKQASLSNGAIAGIAVGGAAVGIIGVLAVIFCLRKKKKEAAAKEEQHIQNNNVNEVADMEVNWDEIEKNYVEVPTSRFTYSPNLADDSTTVFSNDDKTEGSNSPMLIQKGMSPTQRPNVITEHAFVQRPNAVEEIAPTHYHNNQIQKPDGGSS